MSYKSVITYLVCFEWAFTDGIGPETAKHMNCPENCTAAMFFSIKFSASQISGGGTSSCTKRSYGPSICLNGHAG